MATLISIVCGFGVAALCFFFFFATFLENLPVEPDCERVGSAGKSDEDGYRWWELALLLFLVMGGFPLLLLGC